MITTLAREKEQKRQRELERLAARRPHARKAIELLADAGVPVRKIAAVAATIRPITAAIERKL